jgi:serine/threonine protein kinase
MQERRHTGVPELPTMLPEQRQLGPYRLCLKLAAGGMASVYIARLQVREELHRLVALKVLHPRLTRNPQFADMFFDEARIATLIHHPYVCSVFDFDVVDGTYFLAMELLLGESLKRVYQALARGREQGDPARHVAYVARMLTDACEGLHAVHELREDTGQSLGVVHRDVAPDNLVLIHDGVVKVVDFGVASGARRRHRTRTGIVKGKFAYIAPELLRGARPERSADVWGLGVVLWEMLTLRRLFHRSTDVATLGAVLDVDVPPPSAVRAGLPKELDAVVLRALARNPHDRYSTTRELGRDLTRFVAQRGEAVDNASLSEWLDGLFPGGRTAHQRRVELATHSLAHEPRPSARRTAPRRAVLRSMSIPAKGRRRLGLLAMPVAAVLLGLVLMACLGHGSRGPDLHWREATSLAQGPAAGGPRQPGVLELAVTREGGEHRTLIRIRPEPQGDFRVDNTTSVAVDDPAAAPSHK